MSSSESKSPIRQSSERLSVLLAADLMERLGHGSTLYRTTWKAHTTPSGRSLLRARSVGRPISETDCTGWPTCTARLADKGVRTLEGGQAEALRSKGPDLSAVATMTGWTTPAARDWKDSAADITTRSDTGRERFDMLPRQAVLTGWPTPKTATGGANSNREARGAGGPDLQEAVMLVGPARLTNRGTLLTGSGAGTVSGGQLNPDLSRWLMGLPEEWARSMPGWQDWQMWQVLTALVSNEPKPTG